jgi:nucleoside 2-deoxyribosyltransferase
MSKPRIYLAGPIGHLSFEGATAWRNKAAQMLSQLGIAAYSPMRKKDFLAGEEPLPTRPNVHEHPLGTSKGIMTRDHRDCVTADAVLFNFSGVQRVSLGSAMELAWCFDRHIPTVVVAEKDNPNISHPMAHEAVNFRVDTLEEGIELIRTIVLPESEAM